MSNIENLPEQQTQPALSPLNAARAAIQADIERQANQEAKSSPEQYYRPKELEIHDFKHAALTVLLEHAASHPEASLQIAEQINRLGEKSASEVELDK